MVLHTKIVTNMCAKLIDNNGSIMISFIILYLLSKTIMIDSTSAMNKLNIISLPEMISLLPTFDAIEIGGHEEACPKSKCKASSIHVI